MDPLAQAEIVDSEGLDKVEKDQVKFHQSDKIPC